LPRNLLKEESATNNFPDGKFSQPRLAIFAFTSQNKNKAAPFDSRTQGAQAPCSSRPKIYRPKNRLVPVVWVNFGGDGGDGLD
jgi:hypothetical protein